MLSCALNELDADWNVFGSIRVMPCKKESAYDTRLRSESNCNFRTVFYGLSGEGEEE